MSELQELTRWLLLIIPAAGGVRAIYCLIHMGMDDESGQYKTRLKNLLIFIAMAETFDALFHLFLWYFSTGGNSS